MEQPQYSMFHRKRVEDEIAPLARELGLGLTTYSPLYFGILTGKYNDGVPEGSRATLENMAWMKENLTSDNLRIVQDLGLVAAELGITQAQLAIAWVLRRKVVSSVIMGASSVSQLEDNLEAADAIPLMTDDVLARIDAILGNHPVE
jgi:aryl-alcohol dehydrogenase-like predicted oxidoreductase